MNIFVLDKDPVLAAQFQVDNHVNKMLIESCQIMCTVLHGYNYCAPYKATHKNHPATKWAGYNKNNFLWLFAHAVGLSDEFSFRRDKIHACKSVLDEIFKGFKTIDHKINSGEQTPFAQIIPKEFIIIEDPVLAYRNAYRMSKSHLATWTIRTRPYWWK